MPQITLQNGLISYYGNPAGYTEKGTAIVDNIFKNDELTAWLRSRALTPRWTDGVLDKLRSGEQFTQGGVAAASLKNVRIWQLTPDTDIYKKFIGLSELRQHFGEPDPAEYHAVYDGQLGTNNLEAIFERCNMNHPSGYKGHSLSKSDVVELYDSESSEFHYCDTFGFKPVSFEPQEQTQGMEMSMY